MASKLQARIEKLEAKKQKDTPVKIIVRWPGDDDPEPQSGAIPYTVTNCAF